MSTNDPGARSSAAPTPPQDPTGGAAPAVAYAPGTSPPDAAIIARLASEFFAALPGALAVTGISGMPELSSILPVQAGSSPDVPSLFSAPGSALPNDLLETLRVPPQEPVTASVASPSGPSFYFLELARSAPAEQVGASSSAPSLPAVTEYTPAPGADLPSVPNSPVGSTGLPSQVGTALPDAGPSGSSFYFLNGQAPASPNPVPASLPVSDDLSFPQLPGFKGITGQSGLPSAPAAGPEPEAVRASHEVPRTTSAEEISTAPSVQPATVPPQAPKAEIPAVPNSPSVPTGSPSDLRANSPEFPGASTTFPVQTGEAPLSVDALPTTLPDTPHFMFPGIPGFQ